jgi:hypothetical protein
MLLLNYTTKIDPDKTAAEIARCLQMYGAQAVRTAWRIVKDWVEAQMALVCRVSDLRKLPNSTRPDAM